MVKLKKRLIVFFVIALPVVFYVIYDGLVTRHYKSTANDFTDIAGEFDDICKDVFSNTKVSKLPFEFPFEFKVAKSKWYVNRAIFVTSISMDSFWQYFCDDMTYEEFVELDTKHFGGENYIIEATEGVRERSECLLQAMPDFDFSCFRSEDVNGRTVNIKAYYNVAEQKAMFEITLNLRSEGI